jgi:hypothetical protein
MPDGTMMDNNQMRYGGFNRTGSFGKVLPRQNTSTHSNIQSSLNDLMRRNETLFGPMGRKYYSPKKNQVMNKLPYKKAGGTLSGAPHNGQPTAQEFFQQGWIPPGPVGFYMHGGMTLPEAFPQQPPADYFFAGVPWSNDLGHFQTGGGFNTPPTFTAPAYRDTIINKNPYRITKNAAGIEGAPVAIVSNNQYKQNYDQMVNRVNPSERTQYSAGHFSPAPYSYDTLNMPHPNPQTSYAPPTQQDLIVNNGNVSIPTLQSRAHGGDMPCYDCGGHMKDGGWIQKATANMRTDKPCTGSKFGGPDCPPGSKRYNLAKTFRAMAKKQFGGSANNDHDQDDFVSQYQNTFTNAIKNNTAMGMANQVMNQMPHAQNGMEMGDYGYNPNMMKQDLYAQKSNYMHNTFNDSMAGLGNAAQNMMDTANPGMQYSLRKAGVGDAGTGPSQEQLAQMYADYLKYAEQQKRATPNQQAQWNYHPQNQSMGWVPMNNSPHMQWNSTNYPVPVGYNPELTALTDYKYRGRFLGPGPRRIDMKFRQYRDPGTGQMKQIPATATATSTSNSTTEPNLNAGAPYAQPSMMSENNPEDVNKFYTQDSPNNLSEKERFIQNMYKTSGQPSYGTMPAEGPLAKPSMMRENYGGYMANGGYMKQGGPVELTQEEINHILANGGQVQYLD